ncbi:hypothetical protein GCM10023259_037990 [Thermocatellispora tengchongensis]
MDRLKTPAAPNAPMGTPSTVVSIACEASSIRVRPAPRTRTSSGRPYRLVVSTASTVVRSAAWASMLPSRGESGAMTGRSPAASTRNRISSAETGDISRRSPGVQKWRRAR